MYTQKTTNPCWDNDLKEQKKIPCSHSRRPLLLRQQHSPNWLAESTQPLSRSSRLSPFSSSPEHNHLSIAFMRKSKQPRISKIIFEKSKVGGLTFPDFKTYKAAVIRPVWNSQKDRLTGQWNRIKSPEVNFYSYSQLIFNKVTKAIRFSPHILPHNIYKNKLKMDYSPKCKRKKFFWRNLEKLFVTLG